MKEVTVTMSVDAAREALAVLAAEVGSGKLGARFMLVLEAAGAFRAVLDEEREGE